MTTSETVLVVEDDVALRRLIEESLFFDGFHVISVAHGAEALRVLNCVTPRLVVLDLVLPWVNGVEVLATMRAVPRWRSVPVVVVTGSATTEHDLRSFPPLTLLRTPIQLDALTATVQQLLA